jgi:heterodisulfide reductase subunit C
MIRAGKREAVLSSESVWMCTSCYNCIVRCPRETGDVQRISSNADRLNRSAWDFAGQLEQLRLFLQG